MERVKGIEPSYSAWKATCFLKNYISFYNLSLDIAHFRNAGNFRTTYAWCYAAGMPRSSYSGPLPTVGETRAQGIGAFSVTCGNPVCQHSIYTTFDAVAIADDVAFVSIPRYRRFVCVRCGGREVRVMPDWRQHLARGNGRRPIDRFS